MAKTEQELIGIAEAELAECVLRYDIKVSQDNANQLAKDMLKQIDYDLSRLMHKGLSWLAWNYLQQQSIIEYRDGKWIPAPLYA